jgi:hypothetical protein
MSLLCGVDEAVEDHWPGRYLLLLLFFIPINQLQDSMTQKVEREKA